MRCPCVLGAQGIVTPSSGCITPCPGATRGCQPPRPQDSCDDFSVMTFQCSPRDSAPVPHITCTRFCLYPSEEVTMGWFCRTFKNPVVVSVVFSVFYIHSGVPVLIENLKSEQYLVLVELC